MRPPLFAFQSIVKQRQAEKAAASYQQQMAEEALQAKNMAMSLVQEMDEFDASRPWFTWSLFHLRLKKDNYTF